MILRKDPARFGWSAALLVVAVSLNKKAGDAPTAADPDSGPAEDRPHAWPVRFEDALAKGFRPDEGLCLGARPGIHEPVSFCGNAPTAVFHFETRENVTRLDVNLTWAATSPLSEALSFRTLAGVPDPRFENSVLAREALAITEGRSPLHARADDIRLEPGESVWWFIYTVCPPGAAACAHGSLGEQPLVVEGTAWTVP